MPSDQNISPWLIVLTSVCVAAGLLRGLAQSVLRSRSSVSVPLRVLALLCSTSIASAVEVRSPPFPPGAVVLPPPSSSPPPPPPFSRAFAAGPLTGCLAFVDIPIGFLGIGNGIFDGPDRGENNATTGVDGEFIALTAASGRVMVTSEGVVGCKDAWTGAPLAMTLQAAPLSLAVSPMSMVSLSLGPGAMNAWAEELGVSMTGEELAAFDLFDSTIASADMLVAMSVTARVAALADATGQVIDTTKTQTPPGRRLALTSLDGSNAYDVIAQLIIGSEEEGCEDTLYGQAGGRSLTSDDADEMGGCIQKMLTEPAVRHGGGSVCDACTPDSCDNCLCLSADNCLSADQVQALNSLIKKAFDVAVDQTSTATDVLSMQEAVAKSAAAVTVKQTDPPEGLDARQHKSILEAIERWWKGP